MENVLKGAQKMINAKKMKFVKTIFAKMHAKMFNVLNKVLVSKEYAIRRLLNVLNKKIIKYKQ